MASPTSADEPWPVRTLGAKLAEYIERLGQVWIEGEVTQWQTRGGTVYGKLKDLEQDVTVPFQMWASTAARLTEEFRQGDRVVMLAKANWWVKGGSLTMQVTTLKHVGLGELLEKLEKLRRTLAAEGLFAAERKRRLPFLPGVIGLITGRDSDAEKDVKRNAQLRWPSVRFRTEYAAVQGDRTVPEVLAALERLDADPAVEVIVIARGGGDFQNLLGFSDERLVRAVAAASTPIVSAIGHEADRPLLDEVADLRASTPTDAAKRVVPDVAEELTRVQQARGRMANRIGHLIAAETHTIGQLRSRPALRDPDWIIDSRSQELARTIDRGEELVHRRIDTERERLGHTAARLTALSPQSTLDRGYAIVHGAGDVLLRDATAATAGDRLRIVLASGSLGATATGPTADHRVGAEPRMDA